MHMRSDRAAFSEGFSCLMSDCDDHPDDDVPVDDADVGAAHHDQEGDDEPPTGSAPEVAVHIRVRVRPGSDREAHGVVVEDYGDDVGHPVEIGGHRIAGPARRWAVVLDDGGLVFVDDGDLAAE